MKKRKCNKGLLVIGFFLSVLMISGGIAFGEVGVTDTTIKIGNISDTTGPIAAYGGPRVEAVRALIKHVNDQGGIHGRKIILAHESDNYRPSQTVAAFKKLVEVDKVFGFIGSLGVATVMAIVPEIERRKIPYVLLGGNSGKLYYPPKRYMFGLWASYDDFMRILVDYTADDLKMPNARIAHIMQDDETGKDSHKGILKQMKKYPGMKLVSHQKFKRGTVDVSAQVANMKKANPDVVMMSAIFVSNAMIAKEIQKIGWKPKILMNASSGSALLMRLGGTAVEGAIVQVCQKLITDDLPAIRFYKEIMKKYYPNSKMNPTMYGVTGFYEMMVGIEALKKAGRNLTREGFIDALESLKNYDIGGAVAPVTYGSKERLGTHHVIHVKVQNGKFVNNTDWRAPK